MKIPKTRQHLILREDLPGAGEYSLGIMLEEPEDTDLYRGAFFHKPSGMTVELLLERNEAIVVNGLVSTVDGIRPEPS
jgi:hypothetical protein